MTRSLHLSAAFAAILFAWGANAQSYGDPASGLSIASPAGFKAEAGGRHPQFDVTIDISSKTGTPKAVNSSGQLCTLGFKRAAQNAQLTREIVNEQMAKPEWQQLYRNMFETIGTVSDLKLFEHQGFTGIELIVIPKAGPNAQNVRMFTSTMETAKGRTALICVTDQASLAAALPQFKALRSTIHAPE
ncbi:MAG: hypothetical protein DI537_00605 [Stutzerimonas stutzeri]|uniref:DUF1795 domain-containing protein n=1 Tax=Bosea eneae TaxID=151454 RepID=A0ABW0IYI5_9HYPH|nr:MAG: hypothetical protein DI537_00605 [Stutzerimonas stutzeri]